MNNNATKQLECNFISVTKEKQLRTLLHLKMATCFQLNEIVVSVKIPSTFTKGYYDAQLNEHPFKEL